MRTLHLRSHAAGVNRRDRVQPASSSLNSSHDWKRQDVRITWPGSHAAFSIMGRSEVCLAVLQGKMTIFSHREADSQLTQPLFASFEIAFA